MRVTPGTAIWFTGPPATGKTTLAKRLIARLRQTGFTTLWLDSDDLRRVLTPQPTYSTQERDDFYAAIGHIAKLGCDGGAVVIVSATAPKRSHRDAAKHQIKHFIEVWLTAPQPVLEARDPKGLYAQARAGNAPNLPGLGAPYEAPLNPSFTLNSGENTPEELIEQLLSRLTLVPAG